jgi:hypothetical protein
MQHGPNQSVVKSSDGWRIRARGHNNSRGQRRPEIDQSQRVSTAGKSGRESMTKAKEGTTQKLSSHKEQQWL